MPQTDQPHSPACWKQQVSRGSGDDALTEVFVTRAIETDAPLDEQIRAALAEAPGAMPAKIHCFYPAARRAEAAALAGRGDWPLMLTESDGPATLGGVFLHAVTGKAVRPLEWNGRPVGLAFAHAGIDYCYLCDIRGEHGDEAEQTGQVFEALEQLLQSRGMTFRNVLRTWFYNRDILAWYPDFNRVRTAYFKKHGIFDHLVPASTGIGANHAIDTTALVAAAFAVRDTGGERGGRAVPSPLQCPATDYGSSFSRAVRFDAPGHSRLTLSGTASIDQTGETVHIGDFEKQYHFTHEVVGAILEAEGFSWDDVVRGIAYFRHPADAARAENLPLPGNFPVLRTINVVCRDNLLYELEVNAVRNVG